MKTNFSATLYYLYLSVVTLAAVLQSADVTLTEGEVTNVQLPDGGTRLTHYVNLTGQDLKLISIEIHSQMTNLTLSWSNLFTHETTVIGRDVGVLTVRPKISGNIYWFVKADGGGNVLMFVKYNKYNDPIPGGCNQILNLENDPNLLLTYTDYMTSVLFQWGNTDSSSECESSLSQKKLEYNIYVYFVKEGELSEEYYMNAMKNMVGVDNIEKNGRKILTISNDMKTKSNFTLSSTNGQGSIYGVVVKHTALDTSASYVSMASYGCSLTNKTCEVDVVVAEYVIGALCSLVGLGLCFFGHKFLKTEFFMFGFLKWTIISFLLLSIFTSASPVTVFVICWLIGITGGGLTVLLWWYWGIPIFSVLLVGLGGGFLFAAVVFVSPFGNFEIWAAELNYWMAFVCVQLIYVLSLLCFTKTLNILTSAFVGSYMICILIDYLLHTSLKLIIFNIFNHAMVDGFIQVKAVFPFQLNDYIMVGTWAVLFILGTIVQFNQAKGHAPFPPCPRDQRKRHNVQARNRRRAMDEFDNERQPLIFERPQVYHTYHRQEL